MAARAQAAEQERERWLSCQLCRLLAVFPDPCHIDMRYEIVRVGALEYQYLDKQRRPRRAE